MYRKLAGMTGTAMTEAGEFYDIYKLDVIEIPTNRPVIRDDMNDRVYRTKKEKYAAVIQEVEDMVNAGACRNYVGGNFRTSLQDAQAP